MNNGRICVSICAETAVEVIARIRRAEELADVIEVRFDCLLESEIKSLLENLPAANKYIFTFRPGDQGGKREITFDERIRFWSDVSSDSNYPRDLIIDIECDPNLLRAIGPAETSRIVSHHVFDNKNENVEVIWEAISSLTGGVVKIAVEVNDVCEAIPVWELLGRPTTAKRDIIPIAMGEAGKWTRILGLAHGAYMTYGALGEGDETASGQLTANDLAETYSVKQLDRHTDVYGVIGNPVSSSLSPYIHNPAFVSGGINAVFIPLMVNDLGSFMRRMVLPETREVELNFCGFAVTMPHKQAIMKYLDEIDPTAESIGAVNTVKIRDGRSTGYNTDADGFIEPLKKRTGGLADARVAVIGSGGAARACVFALKRERSDVTICGRDGEKGRALAEEFGADSSNLNEIKAHKFDIVVNATPVGMTGDEQSASILNAAELKGVKFVYDLVSAPSETALMSEARLAGAEVIGGLEMLIAQAAKQFEIWTGLAANVELMRSSALKHVK